MVVSATARGLPASRALRQRRAPPAAQAPQHSCSFSCCAWSDVSAAAWWAEAARATAALPPACPAAAAEPWWGAEAEARRRWWLASAAACLRPYCSSFWSRPAACSLAAQSERRRRWAPQRAQSGRTFRAGVQARASSRPRVRRQRPARRAAGALLLGWSCVLRAENPSLRGCYRATGSGRRIEVGLKQSPTGRPDQPTTGGARRTATFSHRQNRGAD
jgi:hypothetical protein